MGDTVNPKVQMATFGKITEGASFKDDTVELVLSTGDGVTAKFDVSAMAVAVLSLTMTPTLQMLKSRIPAPPAPDFDGPLT